MVQNFCEIAENHMNVNFRDKIFVVATFFRDSCLRPLFTLDLAGKFWSFYESKRIEIHL